MGGQLSASGMPDSYELLPSDPLTLPPIDDQPDHFDKPSVAPTIMPPVDSEEPHASTAPLSMPDPAPEPVAVAEPEESKSQVEMPSPDKTLSEIERDVHSSHLNADAAEPGQGAQYPGAVFGANEGLPPAANPVQDTPEAPAPADHVQNARDAVADALNGAGTNGPLPPIQALNAQPLGAPHGGVADAAPVVMPAPAVDPTIVPQPPVAPVPSPVWNAPAQPAVPQYAPDMMNSIPGMPPQAPTGPQMPTPNMPGAMPPQPEVNDPTAPPQVPPPFMPPQFR